MNTNGSLKELERLKNDSDKASSLVGTVPGDLKERKRKSSWLGSGLAVCCSAKKPSLRAATTVDSSSSCGSEGDFHSNVQSVEQLSPTSDLIDSAHYGYRKKFLLGRPCFPGVSMLVTCFMITCFIPNTPTPVVALNRFDMTDHSEIYGMLIVFENGVRGVFSVDFVDSCQSLPWWIAWSRRRRGLEESSKFDRLDSQMNTRSLDMKDLSKRIWRFYFSKLKRYIRRPLDVVRLVRMFRVFRVELVMY